jgi:hypothetical protein
MWCLTHLADRQRASVIVGDLLERFESGESRAWFWRQTLATLAYGFGRAIRDHGSYFAAALTIASAMYVVMLFANSYIERVLIHFQTHALLKMDPAWKQRWGWAAAFLSLNLLETTIWSAIAGWLVARIHRAQPRVIVICAVAMLALHLPRTIDLARNLLTHPRFLNYFIWNVIHLALAIAAFMGVALWAGHYHGRALRAGALGRPGQ